MAEVGIVRRGSAYYREYAIETGDTLIGICLRFGKRDWRAVYNDPANGAFRARFPDPDQIDYVNPVNLFIPLMGATSGGRSRRGAPIGDFVIVRISDDAGNKIGGITLRVIAPGAPHAG